MNQTILRTGYQKIRNLNVSTSGSRIVRWNLSSSSSCTSSGMYSESWSKNKKRMGFSSFSSSCTSSLNSNKRMNISS